MNKWLMSVLLCMSVFFVFGCSGSNVGDEPEIEEEVYEEVEDIDNLDLDLDDEDLNDEDINEEDIEVEVDEEPAEQN